MVGISKDEGTEFAIEPNFQFCWALAWRLLFLSAGIALIPLMVVNLCFGVLGILAPGFLVAVALILGNVLIIILAFAFSLKILLSQKFKNAFIRFYSMGT